MNKLDDCHTNVYYPPFGSVMSERTWEAQSGYRYGFNGQEVDNENNTPMSSYDFGSRVYNCNISRFLSIDSYSNEICWQSAYIFADCSPLKQIDFNGSTGVPVVAVKGNQVLIGGVKWLEKSKYDYAVNRAAGGGAWIYQKAKDDMGASPFGASLVLAFAMEEGGWGKGNQQEISHNPFSLLQQTPNGLKGTAHGYPIIYNTWESGFAAFKDLISDQYPDFLKLVKQNTVTADDINKALKSGPFHESGGYTNSDKGEALVGVLKYAITFTVDQLEAENKKLTEEINAAIADQETKTGRKGGIGGFEGFVKMMKVQRNKEEIAKLNESYDLLKEKFPEPK